MRKLFLLLVIIGIFFAFAPTFSYAIVGVKSRDASQTSQTQEEYNSTMREMTRQDVERVKEEKRRIIEKVRREGKTKRKRRPFEVKDDTYSSSIMKAKKLQPLDTHSFILANNPYAVLIILIILSLIFYRFYKDIKQKMGKNQ